MFRYCGNMQISWNITENSQILVAVFKAPVEKTRQIFISRARRTSYINKMSSTRLRPHKLDLLRLFSNHHQMMCFSQWQQEAITRSLQLHHFPVTAFSQTDLFLVWIYLEVRSPHGNTRDQLQSQARTNVKMSTSCRHVHVRPHCFILTEACSCRLELAYFAEKNI